MSIRSILQLHDKTIITQKTSIQIDYIRIKINLSIITTSF